MIKGFISRITATKTRIKYFKSSLVDNLPMHLATVDVEIKIYHPEIDGLPGLCVKRINIPNAWSFDISGSLAGLTVRDLIINGYVKSITNEVGGINGGRRLIAAGLRDPNGGS